MYTRSHNKPHCPNHDIDLILTDTPGVGICPRSNCRFQYEPIKDEEGKKPEFVNVIEGGQMKQVKKEQFKIVKGSEEGHDWNVR